METLVGKFANLYLYSDVQPYEIVAVSKTGVLTVRAMDYEEKEGSAEKRTFNIGGFVANCNNHQEYNYKSNESNPLEKVRLRKNGSYYSRMGKHKVEDAPRRFYDFNF